MNKTPEGVTANADKLKTPKSAFEEAAMESARQAAHKREMQRADIDGKRPRDIALEKWGPTFEEMIQRDMERRKGLEKQIPRLEKSQPARPLAERDGPDLDR